ncbi:MAG TPA: amidophosphoribosyltransferase [Nitrososphaeraceae archaeon]|jgi:amidophosphoribosyltransferase|nr:amidophosphoribosyltransferase [Nitrososphaeraceae archaeon]
MVHENCGVVGIFSLDGKNVVPIAIDCLRALQHRGQESWGIAVPGKVPFRRLGLVSGSAEHFHRLVRKYRSRAIIGHVRYSTFGRSTIQNAQPLKVRDLCVAHNGTIANVEELAEMVGGCSFTPQTMSDTLIAAQRLVTLTEVDSNLNRALGVLKDEMVGSFCFTFLTDDGSVYAARDVRGFRPLVLGYHKEYDAFLVASESCALSVIGAELVRDVKPGELLKFSERGLEATQFSKEKPHSHCAFEYTYFAHPSSIMEGISIYEARKRIGHLLAEKFPISEADVVIPVPDSARPAALGYAQRLGIPFEEGLLKDRYSKKGSMRSFIEPYHASRVAISSSITPIRNIIEGRNVVIIDDSIVRGTSSASIIEIIRRAGAKKVSILVTYPPIRFPCYAGIDFPSQDELLAYREAMNEKSEINIASKISQRIGADYVGYNDTSNLAKAIGLPETELCFTCSTGDYSPLGIKPIFKSREEMKGDR